MNYIVFDLEWNQSPNGKQFSNRRLPFEIIEIGAVCLNENLEILDRFHRLIRPQVYHWIHSSIHDVIHVNYKDLESGTPFPQAVREFLSWADRGDDWCFCTWGDQDVMELQRNMDYYHLLSLLPGPIVYLDAQKLFALQYETYDSRRSLEYAIDYLKIEKTQNFHRALADAEFTALVMMQLDSSAFPAHISLDVYQHPRDRKEEVRFAGPGYTKFVSREYLSRERAMRDREVASTRCPVCNCNARRTLRWFSGNSKVYYCLASCQEHGDLTGKIRIRRTEKELCFAVKTLRLATEEQKKEILSKKDLLRKKQQQKRNSTENV